MILIMFASLLFQAPSTFPKAATQGFVVPCPADEWAGTIGAVRRVGPRAVNGAAIRRIGFGVARMAAEGDVLCAGETVSNPFGSGLAVMLSLSGGAERILQPGMKFRIPPPTLLQMAANLSQRFIGFFGKGDRSNPNGTKSAILSSNTLTLYAVPEWGTFTILLPGTGVGVRRYVTVESAGKRLVGAIDRNRFHLDLRQNCPRGCSFTVRDDAGLQIAKATIVIATESEVPYPAWLRTFSPRDDERAVLGGWLSVNPDPGWSQLGVSLMWQAGCTYPAVYLHLRRSLPDLTLRELCISERVLTLKPL